MAGLVAARDGADACCMDMTIKQAVDLRSVTKRHGRGAAAIVALDDVTVGFGAGTFTAIMGPSGSGKSTLLQCAAGLDLPDAGQVELDGVKLGALGEAGRGRPRREGVRLCLPAVHP